MLSLHARIDLEQLKIQVYHIIKIIIKKEMLEYDGENVVALTGTKLQNYGKILGIFLLQIC